ncbi:MAG: DUF3300 domain-containing protein [Nitrospirae bacterium]|nr:DUF3300 domain-containing protein [Nitrospirota bacterium]
MRNIKIIKITLAWILFPMLMLPHEIAAQDYGESEQSERFKKEELTQMLASIALYPDSLIAQILIASTYPLEVVEAERWLRQNKGLKGDELDNALKLKPWDTSIKSLCHFPDVLFAMSDKLDQTRKLGDAFLAQEDEVMEVIQELRRKAQEQGNLKTTSEQEVIVEKEIIRIEPANTQVIYIPVYDPIYVYGPWWYPAYPPYYWYYPYGYVITGGYISYSPPFFIGIGLWSWVWFDWHVHHIYIEVHKTKRFHKEHKKQVSGKVYWRHDPYHRKGVAYRDSKTKERFITKPGSLWLSPSSPEIRGYPPKEGSEKKIFKTKEQPVEVQKGIIVPGAKTEPKKIKQKPVLDTPFRGIGNGSFERKASERGSESRKSKQIISPSKVIIQPGGMFPDSGSGLKFSR